VIEIDAFLGIRREHGDLTEPVRVRDGRGELVGRLPDRLGAHCRRAPNACTRHAHSTQNPTVISHAVLRLKADSSWLSPPFLVWPPAASADARPAPAPRFTLSPRSLEARGLECDLSSTPPR